MTQNNCHRVDEALFGKDLKGSGVNHLVISHGITQR